MSGQHKKRIWRIAGVALAILALTTALFNYTTHHNTAYAGTARHGIIKAGKPFPITRMTSVDWSKLPVMTKGTGPTKTQSARKDPYPLTAAQERAYIQALKQHKIIAPAAQAMPLPEAGPSAAQIAEHAAESTNTTNPNFDACGYQVLPCVTHSFPGENYLLQGVDWPGIALASNSSYVMEGSNFGISVYNFNGTIAYGPIISTTFFAPILHSDYDLLGSPRMFWDATRSHWIIMEEEFDQDSQNLTSTYFDIAVSKGQNANLIPEQWYLYQVSTNVNLTGVANICDPSTEEYSFGSDYWGLWLSCDAYSQANETFLGNVVFALSKNALYSGTAPTVVDYTQIPTGISCGTGCLQPAAYLNPAIEDGTPDAEFLLATDLTANTPNASSDLTTVAFADTRALATGGIPSASYVINTLPVSYAYPIEAAQPVTPTRTSNPLFPGIGPSQIGYMGGNLYFAMTTAINSGSDDGVYWAEVQPQLTPLDPTHPQNQMASNTIIRQANIFAFPTGTDAYLPSITGSSEDEEVLVFNTSSLTSYSAIAYTGRRATDAPNEMGGSAGTSATVMQGTWSIDPGNLGTYSSCSLDTNLTARGLIWCGGAFPGPTGANTGWTDQIYALQV